MVVDGKQVGREMHTEIKEDLKPDLGAKTESPPKNPTLYVMAGTTKASYILVATPPTSIAYLCGDQLFKAEGATYGLDMQLMYAFVCFQTHHILQSVTQSCIYLEQSVLCIPGGHVMEGHVRHTYPLTDPATQLIR